MKYNVIILLCCMGMLSGCAHSDAQQAAYRKVSANEAHKMMSELADYIILDVRTVEEYREKRIPGAILIPDYEIKDRAGKELPDMDKVIFVYCRIGRRSAGAARELAKLGYTNVYDFGGIIDWPFDTIGG